MLGIKADSLREIGNSSIETARAAVCLTPLQKSPGRLWVQLQGVVAGLNGFVVVVVHQVKIAQGFESACIFWVELRGLGIVSDGAIELLREPVEVGAT